MGLNFVTELPEDSVAPRSGHYEIARELKANPTSEGWADITKEGGYSKRATASAYAKEINDHTHKAYRDYGYEAVVRTVGEGDTEQHLLFARYNPTLPKAGELAPLVEKPKKEKADAEVAVSEPEAAPATESALKLPATGEAASNGRPRAKAAAASK